MTPDLRAVRAEMEEDAPEEAEAGSRVMESEQQAEMEEMVLR